MKTAILLAGCSLMAALAPLEAAEPTGYVAHEWGTFTSVQGADGVQMEWNPLVTTELPKFVYDRSRPRGFNFPVVAGKTGTVARQRLETPVIYFYSPTELQVSARVSFPEGTVTEWYPQQNPLPTAIAKAGEPAARWEQLKIMAPRAKVPAPPKEAAGSHYYAAREAESNSVQMTSAKAGVETEKFIFYRGIGHFTAPLTVKANGDSGAKFDLRNTGTEALSDLVVYEVRGNEARFAWEPALKAGAARTVAFAEDEPFHPLAETRSHLAADLRKALTKAGLYEAEAAAMVKTWDDAWLAEAGLRVLYLLPRAWTDRTLPLALEPQPRQLTRVMVGRAEVLTVPVERQLETLIERYKDADPEARKLIAAEAGAMGLGRFAEPAIRRISGRQSQNREFINAAWELLSKAFSPAPSAPVLAKE